MARTIASEALDLLRLTRPQFWLLSILPGCVGSYIANNHVLGLQTFLSGAILAMISAVAELTNNYSDQDTDAYQEPKRIGFILLSGGSGATEWAGNSVRKKSYFVVVTLLVWASFGLASAMNLRTLILTIVGIIMAISYSLEPVRLKTRGLWGVFDTALGRGLVSVHIGWLPFAFPTVDSVALGLLVSAATIGSASLAALADYEEDTKLDIRTLPVVHGVINTKRIILISYLVVLSLVISLGLRHSAGFSIVQVIVSVFVAGITLKTWQVRADDVHVISRIQLAAMSIVCICPIVAL